MQALDPQLAPPPVDTPGAPPRPYSAGRAAGIVFLAYLIAHLALVALLLVKPASFGEFGDPRLLGVIFVTVTFVAAFVVSMAWVASPRLTALVGGVLLGLVGVSNLGNLAVGLLLIGFGGALAFAGLAALRRRPETRAAVSVSGRILLPLIALAVITLFWFQEIGRL